MLQLGQLAGIGLGLAHAASLCVLGVDVALAVVLYDVHPQLVVLVLACSPLEMKEQICCGCVIQIVVVEALQDEFFWITKFFNLSYD